MALARGLLSKIHIARQQLGLQDDVYRQKLQVMFGKGSARDLNLRQAEQLLTEFKRLGWQPQPSKRAAGKPHNWRQLPAEVEVIEAQLTNMGLPWSYADAIAKRQFGVAKVAWLKKPEQLKAVLAALHVEQEKRGLLGSVEELLKLLGEHDPNWRVDLEHLPKGWERRRPILKSLVETLRAAASARGALVMQLQCPCCGEQFPVEAGFADTDGKRLAALFAGLDPKLGRAILNYLRLFSPAKRGLRMTRAIKLVEELLNLVNTGTVQKDARSNDTKPASPRLWTTGIEQMITGRERLQLPLENHNYLRAVVWGLASDPAQALAASSKRPQAGGPSTQQLLQDQVGRIQSDIVLGLITKEDGERQIAALKGGA